MFRKMLFDVIISTANGDIYGRVIGEAPNMQYAIRCQSALRHGDSGSPVFTDTRKKYVIGVICERSALDYSVSFCTPIDKIHRGMMQLARINGAEYGFYEREDICFVNACNIVVPCFSCMKLLNQDNNLHIKTCCLCSNTRTVRK